MSLLAALSVACVRLDANDVIKLLAYPIVVLFRPAKASISSHAARLTGT